MRGRNVCRYFLFCCNGIDKILPVDIYLPMCPPRPEALLDALQKLQKNIKKESIISRKEYLESHNVMLKEEKGMLVINDDNIMDFIKEE